jgi:hypothetical protein
VKFSDLITPYEQYEVARARAEISWLGDILTRHSPTITDIFLFRLRKEVK